MWFGKRKQCKYDFPFDSHMATAAWLQNNSGIGIDTSGKRCLNRFSIIFEFLTDSVAA